MKAAGERAGVAGVTLHMLRHTAATLAFRSGWNAKQVQLLLGHRSPAFTLATYVHLLPDDLPDPTFLDFLSTSAPPPSNGQHDEHARTAAQA